MTGTKCQPNLGKTRQPKVSLSLNPGIRLDITKLSMYGQRGKKNKPAGFGKVDSAPDVRTDPALEGFQVVQQVLVRMRKLGLEI